METQLSNIITSVQNQTISWPSADVETDAENSSLIFTLHDHGDLPVTLTYANDEWLVMTEVAPVSAVTDTADFNDALLRLSLALPLVSVGISKMGTEDHYVVFGQLFNDCKPEAISAEIDACAYAALQVAEIVQNDASAR